MAIRTRMGQRVIIRDHRLQAATMGSIQVLNHTPLSILTRPSIRRLQPITTSTIITSHHNNHESIRD